MIRTTASLCVGHRLPGARQPRSREWPTALRPSPTPDACRAASSIESLAACASGAAVCARDAVGIASAKMRPDHKHNCVWSLGWSCSRTVPPNVRPGVSLRTAFRGRTAIERRSNTGPTSRAALPMRAGQTPVRGCSPTQLPEKRGQEKRGTSSIRDASDWTIAWDLIRFATRGQERDPGFPCGNCGRAPRSGATPGRNGLFCLDDRTCRCPSRSRSSVNLCKCRAEILLFLCCQTAHLRPYCE